MIADPYLSVVVTSRNDDHGGDPLVRLQASLRTFSSQCERTGLKAELLVVEWNPPGDKPRLSEALPRPEPCYCDVRFVEVPAELHAGLAYSDVLPLYQMIAKNVGIRRARGQFVLATNIDIIFSDELIEFIAQGQLEAGVLYRVDRHDVESTFPVFAGHAEKIAWCRRHQLRLHQRWGTYPVNTDGTLRSLPDDVVKSPGIVLGSGWHVLEQDGAGLPHRWASESAKLVIDCEPDCHLLEIEVEPHPWALDRQLRLEVRDHASNLLCQTTIDRLETLSVQIRDRGMISLHAINPADWREQQPPYEVRDGLVFRVRRLELRRIEAPTPVEPTFVAETRIQQKSSVMRESIPIYLLQPSSSATTVELTSNGALVRGVGGYLAEWQGRAAASGTHTFRMEYSSAAGGIGFGLLSQTRARWLANADQATSDTDAALEITAHLFTGERFSAVVHDPLNRDGGVEVRVSRLLVEGPSARDLTQSTKLWAVEDRQLPLSFLVPAGPGTTMQPTGHGMSVVTDPGKWAYAAEWIAVAPCRASFFFKIDYVAQDGDIEAGVLSRSLGRWLVAKGVHREVEGVRSIELTVPLRRGEKFALILFNRQSGASRVTVSRVLLRGPLAGRLVSDAQPSLLGRIRTLPHRIAGAAYRWLARRVPDRLADELIEASPRVAGLMGRQQNLDEECLALELERNVLVSRALRHETRALALAPLELFAPLRPFLIRHRPPCLHVNASGDFQLMARQDWLRLGGYAELETYSMNIDGLLGYVAHFAGIREQILNHTCCIYHLEHEKGSGWTPEGEQALRARIDARGISWVDWTTVVYWAACMQWLRRPLLFNLEGWGFSGASLPEVAFPADDAGRSPGAKS